MSHTFSRFLFLPKFTSASVGNVKDKLYFIYVLTALFGSLKLYEAISCNYYLETIALLKLKFLFYLVSYLTILNVLLQLCMI